MARTLFGTDGVRGRANSFPMTAEIALRLGKAAGQQFTNGDHRHTVIIGKDTRLSGYMIEPALTAGFISVGMDVVLVGPMPTPAIAMLVRSMRADLGVMISASHNPYHDNGIKFFGPDGYKLSDAVESQIEELVDNGFDEGLAASEELGRASWMNDAHGRYIEFAKSSFPKGRTLDGMKIVIDCAHGAAYKLAPTVLKELGADVIALGVEPNGFNINDECGSTSPELMAAAVLDCGADIGIALDGDADRVILVDENGQIVDGDQLMAMVAKHCLDQGTLRGGGIVATVMSNMGLETYLSSLGLTLARTQVGDRYVVEHMRAHGFNVGGEQSGHIILSDLCTTGDGLVAALQALAVIEEGGRPVSEAAALFEPVPQILESVSFVAEDILDRPAVKKAIRNAEQSLNHKGRLLIRRSGTEPLVRIMGECEDEDLMRSAVSSIVDAIAGVQ